MELFRALAVLAEPPTVETARLAEALELGRAPTADEYTELFVFQLYPYASVYLGAEGMMGGVARDRVAGFWRALGETPPAEADHLSVMLALYALLVEFEEAEQEARRRTLRRGARKAFLWEHLLSWLPVYLMKVADLAPPCYRRWGEVLMTALLEEAEAVGAQQSLSQHLREGARLVDPRGPADAGEFLQSILTPVRLGAILTRADLVRAGRRLGLGLRMGERKFILKALLGQDARAMFDWLLEETVLWGERHHANSDALGIVARAWEEKTSASAVLLKELKREAEEKEKRSHTER